MYLQPPPKHILAWQFRWCEVESNGSYVQTLGTCCLCSYCLECFSAIRPPSLLSYPPPPYPHRPHIPIRAEERGVHVSPRAVMSFWEARRGGQGEEEPFKDSTRLFLSTGGWHSFSLVVVAVLYPLAAALLAWGKEGRGRERGEEGRRGEELFKKRGFDWELMALNIIRVLNRCNV